MVPLLELPSSPLESQPSQNSTPIEYYQDIVPVSPLNGPTISLVIQPA